MGGIFFANGWHKLEAGLTATADQFATLGAPGPGTWAATTMLTELIGGALMVAGLAVPACGLLLFAEAVAVFVVASGDKGLPLTGGDVNLIVALGAASILLAVGGAGRLSVDHMVVIKRRETEAAEDFAAEAEADDVLAALRDPETPRRVASVVEEKEKEADRPVPPENLGSATGTAESPARSRTRRRSTASTTEPTPAPASSPVSDKDGDTLVAGKKNKPAQS